MPSLSVVPSLPAATFAELERVLTAVAPVTREFQVDIVDGAFVPFVSWPFTEVDPMAALALLAPFKNQFALEFDCMVLRPEQYLDALVALGARRIIIHVGSTTAYAAIASHARVHGYQLGIAATGDVPLEVLDVLLPDVDFVQLMGIAKVGQQGQPFDERTIARANQLRARYPELTIAVDGSVNTATMPRLLAAGVNRFAPGSAVAKADDPAAALIELKTLVGL